VPLSPLRGERGLPVAYAPGKPTPLAVLGPPHFARNGDFGASYRGSVKWSRTKRWPCLYESR